jgi:hypothetical protein
MTPETCAVFRRCEGPRPCRCGAPTFLWVVQTLCEHEHQPGDRVTVGKKDGTAQTVALGKPLVATYGGDPAKNCFLIARPKLKALAAADSVQAVAEVAELERLSRL